MGTPITQLVNVIRSKNAGPYELTFDLIFKDEESYNRVRNEKIINKGLISNLYKIPEDDVISIINFDPARAIKITIKRPVVAGSPGDRDVYGAQQHAPLLTIMV
ncbi:DUF4387 domain-containing protein [Halothermothrix orenii]|uniref:DUF4387 domain-containing protein n=1 Tax=Halothermothrix orenii (strain H 168 / OCM 544 / DSM 9562) TaxID=373903 RepID=B8CYC1_HALOH|nr:DUF4387 domain-containing protein [Halothermothrix orenii]ACL70290.1 hypothetical protein Hore_15410 [Halothermothrix orenii H 168]